MVCRVSSDLRAHELAQELGEREWINACPSMRETVNQQAVELLQQQAQHPLWMRAFEDAYMQSEAGMAELNRCASLLALGRNDGVHIKSLDRFAEVAINAVVAELFGRDENIESICEDGYSARKFISEIMCQVLEKRI